MKAYFIVWALVFLSLHAEAQNHQSSGREVSLEGAVNFRDLGGYTTTGYRRIAMKRIYRAGNLSQLTDADLQELKRRKIYTVIDFRSDAEADSLPDRLLPGADYLRLPAGNANATRLAMLAKEHSSGTAAMTAFYSDVSSFKEKYRAFFRKLLLAPDTSAIVFHCSSGKDCTGIAAALFLYALDVPPETILADYVASNLFLKAENETIIHRMGNEQGIDRATATEIADANPMYLEATLNALKRRYGSVDAFLYQELGLNEMARQKLREKFLQ